MAVEIKTNNLSELKDMAVELLDKSENAEDVKTRKEFDADIDTVITEYNKISKANCYKAAAESGDPLRYAVLQFSYPGLRVKETKDKDTGAILREIADTAKSIDLGDLHKRCDGIGADKKWIYALERFNFYLTIRAAERVGAKVNSDAFVMNEISKEISLGKTPCSNTQLLKTLQTIVTMMLGGEYKATSHDVHYLVDCYANDSKKSKTAITLANHKTLRQYMKKICYRILTNGTGYDVEQKEIKEEKK